MTLGSTSGQIATTTNGLIGDRMSVDINNRRQVIAVGDIEPSALDLTRHMLSGESITSAGVIAGTGMSIVTGAEIGVVNEKFGRSNRDMVAGKFIKWTHSAISASSATYIDIDFTTNLGQTKNLRLNFEVIS
jgi:hypothetical protein